MTNLTDFSKQLADTAHQVSQSVVSVQAERPVSGSVVAENLVLTVAHVLRGDEVSLTTSDGRTLSASVVGSDPISDLALLRVEGLNLPALSATQQPQIGEILLAVGRPPHGPQVALGLMQRSQQRGWMESGAQPFPGVSGGALVSTEGQLVGVLNAGVRRGQLVAVTAERAMKVTAALSATGRVPRGYLGIGTQPVHFPDSAKSASETETPAGAAPDTHRPDAQHRPDPRALWAERFGRGPLEHLRPEDQGPFRSSPEGGFEDGPRGKHAKREQKFRERAERLRERWEAHERGRFGPAGFGGRDKPERGGFPFGPFDGRNFGGFDKDKQPRSGRWGLTIVQLEAGSPAESAGLKVGDVLLSLGGESVRHPAELLARVSESAGETLSVRILRGGEEQDLTVTIGER